MCKWRSHSMPTSYIKIFSSSGYLGNNVSTLASFAPYSKVMAIMRRSLRLGYLISAEIEQAKIVLFLTSLLIHLS